MPRKQIPLMDRKIPTYVSIPYSFAIRIKDFNTSEIINNGLKCADFEEKMGVTIFDFATKQTENIKKLNEIIQKLNEGK